MIKNLSFLLLFFLLSATSHAQEAVFPRFASLRSDTVYMRAGPGERFPIEWVYKRKNFPILITDSFEHWHKVQDIENTQGWIHKSMLSGKRTGYRQKRIGIPDSIFRHAFLFTPQPSAP